MNLKLILVVAVAFLGLGSLLAVLDSSKKIYGSVSTTWSSTPLGCAGVAVYVFSRKQIDDLVLGLKEKRSIQPSARVVFANLPFDKCIAKTETYVHGNSFEIKLDKLGDFVLAVDAHKSHRVYEKNGEWISENSNNYWLYPFEYKENQSSLRINLTDDNTVTSTGARVFSLPL